MGITSTGWIGSTYQIIHQRKVVLTTVLLIALPLALDNFTLSTTVLIFAMFAMAYNLALGETGMLTFGHAAFFGLGAYGSGMFLVHVNPPAWLGFACLIVGTLLATIGGAIIGALSLRRRGTYLALITLAFAQMVYFIMFQFDTWTGGDDGLLGIQTPELGIPGVFILSFTDGIGPLSGLQLFYFFLVGLFIIFWLSLRRIKRSNFGRTLNAIRENENRARFLGFNVQRYRFGSFVLSAAFSGFAGSLYAPYYNYVGLDTLNWLLSGEVNFWVLLGGIGSFIGAAVGTMIYYIGSDTLSQITSYWQLFMGLLLIFVVLYFPEGIVGTIKEHLSENLEDDQLQDYNPTGTDSRPSPEEGK